MRILIVEDEKRIAKQLGKLIREIMGSSILRLNQCETLKTARNFMQNNPIDLLFLDLNLKGLDGFELLKEVVADSFQTIIISAYTEEAIRAFEYGVLDFIAKPFNKERLSQAISRFIESGKNKNYFLKYLAVKKFGKIDMISLDNINYIKASGHYSELHLINSKMELHSKSLDKLMVLLPDSFDRIHRSYAVELSRIVQFKRYPGSKYEVMLENGTTLPCSRRRYKELAKNFI